MLYRVKTHLASFNHIIGNDLARNENSDWWSKIQFPTQSLNVEFFLKLRLKVHTMRSWEFILNYIGGKYVRFGYHRGDGRGSAGGAIAPRTFGSSIMVHSNSNTNIFGPLNIC